LFHLQAVYTVENIRFLPAKNVNRDDDMNYMVVTKEETIGPAELDRDRGK
jgi:hypothetical protein